MMSKRFNILVLSDAHIGKDGMTHDASEVFRPLLNDIRNSDSRPEVVIFAGDLSYSGKNNQYKEFKGWIDQLYKNVFGASFKEIPLFLVPGNHDVDRDTIKFLEKDFAEKYDLASDAHETIFNATHRDPSFMQTMLARQQEWITFAESLDNPACKIDNRFNFCSGILDHGRNRIGILGLNSAWASGDNREDGKLWIGKAQYQAGFERVKDATFRIAFSHHSLDCLNKMDRQYLKEKIETNFKIFIHGHQHFGWLHDSENHLTIESGACYQGSEKENVYAWIEIDFEAKKARVKMRELKKGDVWGPYVVGGKTDDKGIAEIHNIFGSEISTGDDKIDTQKIPPASNSGQRSKEFDDLKDSYSLIKRFDTNFDCTWEPPKDLDKSRQVCVFWPVRLRKPSPIHAVQSFAAAALSKKGVEVVLFMDELGNKDVPQSVLEEGVKAWFGKVRGEVKHLKFRYFTPEIATISDNKVSKLLQGWLGVTTKQLKDVLSVSKLWPADESQTNALSKLGAKRPRRILSPVMVWACLAILSEENADNQLITLGGYDERGLWQAWRDTISNGLHPGHLYISELAKLAPHAGSDPYHMDDPTISWESRGDLIRIIDEEMRRGNWAEKGRFIPWSISGLVLLPCFISGKSHSIMVGDRPLTRLSDLKYVVPDHSAQFVESLADELCNWFL
jgi:predicted phosphodiesterase